MTVRTLLLGFAATVILYLLFWLLLKNPLRTGIYVTVLLFAMFLYGVFYEYLEALYYAGKWPFRNIHRYLLLFYALVLAGSFVFLYRSKRGFTRLNTFLNILLILLLIFNLIRIVNYDGKKYNNSAGAVSPASSVVFAGNAERPDIYYIVLDGYASGRVLNRYYNFNNRAFRKTLMDAGFLFADSAFANHYFTSHSLCSTLNMTLNTAHEKVNGRLADNKVMRTLKDNGYNIYHLNSGYAVTSFFHAADSCLQIDGPNEFEKSMLRYTMLRLDDLVGFFARQRLQSQFDKMYQLTQITASPKFSFIHIVAPHPPYVFNSSGGRPARQRFTEHSWEPADSYISQLEYVNKRMAALLLSIRQRDPQAIIVLQSDHGPWISSAAANDIFTARAGILYAWYTPEKMEVPRGTSAVNTFPYLFNSQFGTSLPLLPDSAAGREQLLQDPILTKKMRH